MAGETFKISLYFEISLNFGILLTGQSVEDL